MPRDSAQPPTITAADLCHPTLRHQPFTRAGWLFQLKHDGFRALAITSGSSIRLLSRNGRSLAEPFPEVVRALSALPCDAVLDAELIVPDANGRSAFERLRRRNLLERSALIDHAAAIEPAVLLCFDLLAWDGEDLRSRPLSFRRQCLQQCVNGYRGLQVIESVKTHGAALFALACDQDHGGIVAKRLDASYLAGRQDCWIKVKNKAFSRQAAVVWQG